MEDLIYTAGDTFMVGPKTPKHIMDNTKTNDTKFVLNQLNKSVLILNSLRNKFCFESIIFYC